MAEQRTRRWIWIFMSSAAGVVIIAALIYFRGQLAIDSCLDQGGRWDHGRSVCDSASLYGKNFDAAIWANTPEGERRPLAQDLIDRRLLQEKKLTDVIATLGVPSSYDRAERYLTYIIGTGGSGFDQVQILEIRLNPVRDVVEDAKIRGD